MTLFLCSGKAAWRLDGFSPHYGVVAKLRVAMGEVRVHTQCFMVVEKKTSMLVIFFMLDVMKY